MRHSFRLIGFSVAFLCAGAPCMDAAKLSFQISSSSGRPLPCRIHLTDDEGKAHHPPDAPFWRGGFVCQGEALLELPPDRYHYEIERGPEWSMQSGTIHLTEENARVEKSLSRVANLKQEGWFGGDLHVHRAPHELPLHLVAEDLSIASVQTWWNASNPWKEITPANSVKEHEGRYHDILGGEDERGGGALLYHRMEQTIDITQATREHPSSVDFLRQAKRAGGWAEIEKPFWWDTPLWLSTGLVQSVGLAHNHMNRSQVLGTEAWGRPRDEQRFPGVHGNGLYTQDLYYKILNCGLRIPPSAGSASGVLPNPVGYNRVYVHTGGPLRWDEWWEGLRQGRSFVTNGPLLRLEANGKLPGEVFQSDAALDIVIEGAVDSRDPIKTIELVHNGVIKQIDLPSTLTIEASGWFLVRSITSLTTTFRFASTAPWYVEIGGEPMKPRTVAARFFLEWAQQRKALVEQALEDEHQRREVSAEHAKAVAYWEQIMSVAVP